MGRTPCVDCNMHLQTPTSPHENYTKKTNKKKQNNKTQK